MADISKLVIREDPTLEKINKIIKESHFHNKSLSLFKIDIEFSNYKRGYLGASSTGDECERKLWYNFRFIKKEDFDIKSIKRFQSGYFSEQLMIYRLQLLREIELYTENEKDEQFGLSDFGDHFSGHMDGAIKGLLQAPKTWHVWEHKDSEKIKEIIKLKQNTDEKEILKKWNLTYYGQAQIYMGYTEMTRHYMTISSPGGRDEISIRTNFNKEDFENLKNKAKRIIESKDENNLFQLSDRADFYKCKWCNFNDICHNYEIPEVNCRTCLHSTPIMNEQNAKWRCEKDNKYISLDQQERGCNSHLYIPSLLDNYGQPIEADENETYIIYKTKDNKYFCNCLENSFPDVDFPHIIISILPSVKMYEYQEDILNDPVQKVVNIFDGGIVKNSNQTLFKADLSD